MTKTVKSMVTGLNNPDDDGGFWLPNIQRPFVWTEEQIERLFDSIMREYPISTLLVWRTDSEIRRRKFIDNYRRGMKLSDFYVPAHSKPKMLVLDGQQRLQSLYIGLMGSYDKKELYFDVLSGGPVNAPDDMKFRFKFLTAEKAAFPYLKFKDLVFSEKKPRPMNEEVVSGSDRPLSEEELDRIGDNLSTILTQFKMDEVMVYQKLDSIGNAGIYNEDDVVEIFIRANAGGTRLGKSDLLFSLLSSTWDESDERMDELLTDLNKTGFNFDRDFVLKTCLTLLNKGAQYEVAKFRDPSIREELVEKWDEIADAICAVRDALYNKTFIRTGKAIPSYLALIPPIYARYHFPDTWAKVKRFDEYALRTLLTGAFSATPDHLINQCTNRIRDTGEFDVDKIFNILRGEGRSLEITRDTILSQYYGSRQIHLLFNYWYRNFNYIPAYENNLPQVDHIFPQSLLKQKKRLNPDSGREDLLVYYQEDRDQIANCMLLTAEENGAGHKCDIPPDVWFADKDDSYLDLHLIPRDPELWKLDNYNRFIEARKALILKRFAPIILQETTP